MMNINLDEKSAILYVKPNAALKAEDFLKLTTIVDTYVKNHGVLKGLVIETKSFPGWENMKAFGAHVKFIKGHHTDLQKVALVTNSKFAELAKACIGPFIAPQIKHFPFDQVELATQWIEQ